MKKLYPLLSVLFLIFWGCLDPLNIFDFNDEETIPDFPVEDETINLWGVDYSYIYNNQLCPPYPSCVENYVGEQDTSDCP